jgi:hypothetical protein
MCSPLSLPSFEVIDDGKAVGQESRIVKEQTGLSLYLA